MMTQENRESHFGKIVLTNGFIILLLLIIPLILLPIEVTAQSSQLVDQKVEEALLTEDWAKVANLLDSVNPQTPSPVLRLIKGHACLALNRNNESLCLFLSASSENDLKEWERWTQEFASRNPKSPISYYFKGDAYARLKQWDNALSAFKIALGINPKHILVLNSRGVTYAAIGQFDAARDDFLEATKHNPSFADLYTNRGTFILQRRTDAIKAIEWFDHALRISPDFVLALNGRGASRIQLRGWDAAASDLKDAKKQTGDCLSEIAGVIDLNLVVLTDERNKAVSVMLARAGGIEPGMSLDQQIRILDGMLPGQRQVAYDIINNARNFNSSIQGGFWNPSQTELGISGGLKGSLIGPQPYVEGKVSGIWDWAGKAKYNQGLQTDLMGAMKERYGITNANPISNFDAWNLQHMLPGGEYGKLTSPGGVSSREIGEQPVDIGNWNVFTLYGLLYKIRSY